MGKSRYAINLMSPAKSDEKELVDAPAPTSIPWSDEMESAPAPPTLPIFKGSNNNKWKWNDVSKCIVFAPRWCKTSWKETKDSYPIKCQRPATCEPEFLPLGHLAPSHHKYRLGCLGIDLDVVSAMLMQE